MANAAANDALSGTILADRYRLTRLLGSGGMGSVYAATALDTGTPVAIKLLHREFLGDPGVLDRFLEEARTGQKLVHPNIVRIFGTGRTEENLPFLVMELLDGVPLSAYTKNGGRVPLPQAVPILQALLFGLGAAHAEGIVHRDLKPENIFLAREAGGQFVAKILDFGIAKVMDEAGGMGKRTSTGMLLGTPAYMSPEQIKNSKDVDPRSDLFSLGILFYEMLTGRQAFPAPNEFAKLSAVLTVTPEPVERIDPQLSFLSLFIARAIQKDRAQRFQSAAEMMHALAGALGHDPSRGRAPPPLSRLPDVPLAATARVAASPFVGAVPAGAGAPGAGAPGAAGAGAPGAGAPATATSPSPEVAHPAGASASGEVIAASALPAQVSISEARRRLLETPISSSDTLASARGNQPPVHDPPPQVLLVPAGPDSSAEASRGSRGVAPWIVAALVAAALIAGFVLGLAVGRAL
ncbi:serine/threonine-protein kinase [Pendulispora albinea]|uniref:Serine/threonine protein kinase n=1 Tax=Pendulispora albinea TaxID=2741071 RepID=A0ABZ2LUE0_9BACT